MVNEVSVSAADLIREAMKPAVVPALDGCVVPVMRGSIDVGETPVVAVVGSGGGNAQYIVGSPAPRYLTEDVRVIIRANTNADPQQGGKRWAEHTSARITSVLSKLRGPWPDGTRFRETWPGGLNVCEDVLAGDADSGVEIGVESRFEELWARLENSERENWGRIEKRDASTSATVSVLTEFSVRWRPRRTHWNLHEFRSGDVVPAGRVEIAVPVTLTGDVGDAMLGVPGAESGYSPAVKFAPGATAAWVHAVVPDHGGGALVLSPAAVSVGVGHASYGDPQPVVN